MQRQLIAIERTLGILSVLRVQEENTLKLRRDSHVQEALSSVQIEGNQLSYEQSFEIAARVSETGDWSRFSEDEREFLNYLCAFDEIDDLRGARDYQPNAGDLKNLHRVIVEGVRGGSRHAGRFRQEDVKVGDVEAGETVVHHQPPHWTQVDDEIESLMEWIGRVGRRTDRHALAQGAPDEWVHAVIIAGIAHHRLVWIHPFVDGNGRTARMFTTLLLYYRSYDFKYLFELSNYYNEDRDAYYNALRSADRTGDYTQWIEYFMGGLAKQQYMIGEKALKIATLAARPSLGAGIAS